MSGSAFRRQDDGGFVRQQWSDAAMALVRNAS
jgi:hypothetical protein